MEDYTVIESGIEEEAKIRCQICRQAEATIEYKGWKICRNCFTDFMQGVEY